MLKFFLALKYLNGLETAIYPDHLVQVEETAICLFWYIS